MPMLEKKINGKGCPYLRRKPTEKKQEHIKHVVFVRYFSVRFLGIMLQKETFT
jgi:hypothetical protein